MPRRVSIPLLIVTAFCLPRLTAHASAQTTSIDRPEHPLLTPLTSNPVNTVIWGIIAALISTPLSEDNVVRAVLAQIGATLLFIIPISCFGAPLSIATVALAAQLSAFTVYPAVHAFGLPSLNEKGLAARYRMTRLFCDFSPESPSERSLVYPAVGAIIGAWVGGFSLALDWDRPWQTYPLPPSIASTIGYIIALAYA